MWEQSHGRRNPGQPVKTTLRAVIKEGGLANKDELVSYMQTRVMWSVKHWAQLKS